MTGEPTPRKRSRGAWALLVCLQLCFIELLLSAYFFHKRSEYPLAIVHYAVYGWERLTKKALPTEALGIYEDDARFGYRHRPRSQGRHRTNSFDALYTIGAERERPIPAPSDPKGRILFLGSSITFGYGVADDETFPYLLGTSSWRDWEVVDKAVSGWGTAHAYMLLKDELDGPHPPALALYDLCPDHICRNYLRPLWLEMLARSKRAHPHFELQNGELVFQGLATVADAAHDEDDLRRKELALTESFILGMHECATAHGARFAVVLLPQRFGVACGPVAWPPSLIRSLTQHGVALLDLSELQPRMTWLEYDAHPDPAGHRVLATAIAGSFLGESLSAIARERAGRR